MCEGMCSARRRRGDLRIRVGITQAERRVDGIVIGVNQVVRGAGMLRILRRDLLDNRGGAHVDREVAAAVAGAEQRERVERLHFVIAGILVGHALHRFGGGLIARQLLSGTVGFFDRGCQPFLSRSAPWRGVHPRSRRTSPARPSRGPRGALPHRVIESHGLAPVGHCKRGVGFLRLDKRLSRIVVLELCISSTPLMNSGCAAVEPEVGKSMEPSSWEARLCWTRPGQQTCDNGGEECSAQFHKLKYIAVQIKRAGRFRPARRLPVRPEALA